MAAIVHCLAGAGAAVVRIKGNGKKEFIHTYRDTLSLANYQVRCTYSSCRIGGIHRPYVKIVTLPVGNIKPSRILTRCERLSLIYTVGGRSW